MKNHNDNNYVLITGASSGIGYEIAKLYAVDGYNLVLVARNIDKLKKVKNELDRYNIKLKILSLDITKDDEIEELFNYVEKNKISVSTLINNAGIGSFGDFKDINWKKEEQLLDINIKSLTRLTKYFLPKIIELKSGGILNVSSTAAFCSGPRMATYYASKSYVLNLTEALYEECKGSGIRVSCLCPGPVRTDFQSKAGIKKSESAKRCLMDADIVAKVGYKEFNKGKVIIIPGLKNKLLVIINKFLPRSISRKIIKMANKNEK